MKDYSNSEIYILLADSGARVGAFLQFDAGTSMRLDNANVVRLGEYLRKHNLQLHNAKISEDGSLLPLEGEKVLSKFVNDTDDISVQGLPITTVSLLTGDCQVYTGAAERKLLTVIKSGIELAAYENIEISIIEIEKLELNGKRSAPFMQVHASCKGYWGFWQVYSFTCYLDDTVVITAWWAIDEPKEVTKNEDRCELRCKSAVDIRNGLLWLKNTGLTRKGSTSCADYLKYKRETAFLVADSKQYRKITPFEPIKLRHSPFEDSLRRHVTDLVNIKNVLNERFEGTYAFDWKLNDKAAVLYVSKYTGVKDVLVELSLELRAKAVCVKYKIIDAAVSQPWIGVAEYSNIEWLDELGNTIESILGSVFRPGELRCATHIVACGVSNDVRYYFICGQVKPLSEGEIIQKAQNGELINGVCFRVLPDKSYEIAYYGYDQFGNELPRYAELDGKGYFRISIGFRDEFTSEWLQVDTIVSVSTYCKVKSANRATSLKLIKPVDCINDMLSNLQHGPLDYLGDRLNDIATARNYTVESRISLLLSFIRCFAFTRLVDTPQCNKTPVEVLVERSGCGIELSLFAATLARKIGLSPALIFRYSPIYTETRFHVILGIKKTYTQSMYEERAKQYCAANELVYFDAGGYIGLDFTCNVAGHLGAVHDWTEEGFDAVQTIKRDKADNYNQLILVPIQGGFNCVKSYVQSSKTEFILSTPIHWETVSSWFKK